MSNWIFSLCVVHVFIAATCLNVRACVRLPVEVGPSPPAAACCLCCRTCAGTGAPPPPSRRGSMDGSVRVWRTGGLLVCFWEPSDVFVYCWLR